MAVTKQQLKSIVKECLIEILAEGMGSSTASSINEVKQKSRAVPSTSNIVRQNASNTRIQSAALKEAIRREAGGNDIMASILADTAEKTLPSMLENDRTRVTPSQGGGTFERMVATHNPEDLFGEEATSKWADLAFASTIKK